MKSSKMPSAYIGREQAYIKHTILKTYLQRLFMIVGQGATVINYVDCFAGPWEEENNDLSDTSIGISLQQMRLCQNALNKRFGKTITFRALYIEKNEKAFNKLNEFLSQQAHPNIETSCFLGDYTDRTNDIVNWSEGHFTFFFVDPLGWKDVIGAKTMLPLLQLENAEFLINLMYDFVNRFVEHNKHVDDMIELFGEAPSFESKISPEDRKTKLLSLYRNNLKHYYNGRTAYVPIEKPGKDRVHYYLVYLTRHSVGIKTFKKEAESVKIVQRITQTECKLRKQLGQTQNRDLFGDITDNSNITHNNYADNRNAAKEFLLGQLSEKPLLIDNDKWADFLEETDLYPSDFQLGMKELAEDGKVVNIDADVSRRRTLIIKPEWPNKSERWVLAK